MVNLIQSVGVGSECGWTQSRLCLKGVLIKGRGTTRSRKEQSAPDKEKEMDFLLFFFECYGFKDRQIFWKTNKRLWATGWADKSQSLSDFCYLLRHTKKQKVVWCRRFALGKLRIKPMQSGKCGCKAPATAARTALEASYQQ